MAQESGRTGYHYGFYAYMRYHYGRMRAPVRYEQEVQLGEEPVRLDFLIIKKNGSVQLTDPIGRFFRSCNLIEYKSPEDSLSVDDFYKAQGYALIYKGFGRSVNELPIENMTLTLVRHSHPRAMIETLTRSGIKVIETHPGIYHFEGKISIDTQLVVSSRLKKGEYEGLRLLTTGVSKDELVDYMKRAISTQDPNLIENAGTAVSTCLSANPDLAAALSEEESMDDVVRKTFKRQFDEAEARGEARGEALGEARGEARGEALGEARGEARGQAQQARATVERMLMANYDVAEIMYMNGVTYDQVADVALAVGIELPRN